MKYIGLLAGIGLLLAAAGAAMALSVVDSSGESILPDEEGRIWVPWDAIDTSESWRVNFCETAGSTGFDLMQVKMISGDLLANPGFANFHSTGTTTSPYPQTGAALAASWHEYFNSPTVCAATGDPMEVFSPKLYSHNKMDVRLSFQGTAGVNAPVFCYQVYYDGQLVSNEKWTFVIEYINDNHAGYFIQAVDPLVGGNPGPGFWQLTHPIPEPVTMAGLVLGVGCLARYVRRRRAL